MFLIFLLFFCLFFFFFSSRRRHTRLVSDWSSDVCSSDLNATMWGGSIHLSTSMLYAVAFLIEFVIGGLSGIVFAVEPLDWQTTDTYFVVAHFHYVAFGGSAFGILAGLYYWFPKMSGRMLDERLGKLNFWLMV